MAGTTAGNTYLRDRLVLELCDSANDGASWFGVVPRFNSVGVKSFGVTAVALAYIRTLVVLGVKERRRQRDKNALKRDLHLQN